MNTSKFYKKIAAPASGKSYGAIQYMLNKISKEGTRFVLAAISADLCRELKSEIERMSEGEVVVDILLSAETYRVRERYEEALEDKDCDILIITHTNLINSYGKVDATGWECIMDELPNILAITSVNCTLEDDVLSTWLSKRDPDTEDTITSSYASMQVKLGWEDKLATYLDNVQEEESDYLLSKSATEGLKGVMGGDTKILRYQYTEDSKIEKVRYYFCTIHNPYQLWRGFNKVTFLCAEFEKQLTGLLFKHKYNILVEDNKDITLYRTYYEKPERITIYVLLHSPTNFSKTLSMQYYNPDNKLKKKIPLDGYKEVFEHLVDVCEKIVGEDGYIYTVNNMRAAMVDNGNYNYLSERAKVKRLKYNPHGLNTYKDHTNAVGLFHCNASTQQLVVLDEIAKECGVPVEIFRQGYSTTAYLDPLFQLVTRTAIRKFDDLEDIVCVVPDERAAKYLTDGWFKGATVSYDYATTFEDGRKGNGGKNKSFVSLLEMTAGEKSAFYRWAKRLGNKLHVNNKKDYEKVDSWLKHYRAT